VLSRWIFRQGYWDASTRPSAAGVTGILDPRRDPGCCAASRVDRLRWAASRRRWAWRASRARRASPASVIRSRVCAAASCHRMSGCMVSPSRGRSSLTRIELAYRNRGSAHNGTAIGDSGPGVAGLPPVAAAPHAACVRPAAADGPGILL